MRKELTFERFVCSIYTPFYESKKLKNSYAELKALKVMLRCSIAFKPLKAITKNDVMAFLCEIENTSKIKKATVNRYKARIHSIMAYAESEGYVNRNPAKGIKKYKEFFRSRFLSNTEIASLLEECKNSRNKELYTIVVLALNTGMRKNEIMTLSRKDISAAGICNKVWAKQGNLSE